MVDKIIIAALVVILILITFNFSKIDTLSDYKNRLRYLKSQANTPEFIEAKSQLKLAQLAFFSHSIACTAQNFQLAASLLEDYWRHLNCVEYYLNTVETNSCKGG